MRKNLVFILILFTSANLFAQNKIIDSLKLRLSKEKTDTGRIKLLISMGRRFGFGTEKNDSAIWYSQQAAELSKKINYTEGEVNAQYGIANYLFYTGNYPAALKVSLQNIALAEQHQQVNTLIFQTRLTGWIYGNIGDYKKQLEYQKKMSVIAQSESDSTLRERHKAMADNCISQAYTDLNMPDSALHYMLLVYKNVSLNTEGFSLSTGGLGNIYSNLKKDDSAFFFYRICIPYAKKAGRRDVVAGAQLGMAKLFYKREQLDSAFSYAKQSLSELQNIDDLGKAMDAYSFLSNLYKKRQQYDSAFKYMENYVSVKDSIFNQKKITQAQDFGFNETMRQQQLAQAKKDAEQEYKNRFKFYLLGSVILVFLILAFLLYRNLSNKRKANILLGEQNEEIQKTLSELKSTQAQLIQSEKMASLGELTAGIAHEIQNPLNFVNNFSEVNKELAEELKSELAVGNLQLAAEITDDIKANSEKINHHGKRADTIVKGMLQHSQSGKGQKEFVDINALCEEYLRLSYHGLKAKDSSFNVTIQTDFDNSINDINIVPQDIGRVLLNLYNNAFYAVNEETKLQGISYQPQVSVSTKKAVNTVEIKVEDNGSGIPQSIIDKIFQPFFTTKPTGKGTGLGLSLSYDIIKAHGGELNVVSREGEGSKFIIKIPNIEYL